MKTRYVCAALAAFVLAASQASASIIAASGQYRAVQPSERAAPVNATSVQSDLNSALRGVDTGTAAVGNFSGARVPSTASGGFMITSGGKSAVSYVGSGTHAADGVLGSSGGNVSPGITGGTVTDLGSGHHRRGGRHDRNSRDRWDNDWNRFHGGSGNLGGNNGIQVAPEPSTWILLATGLMLLGGVAVLRRRQLAAN